MRNAITSSTASSVGPYSHAIESDGLVLCSGQTPIDPATGELCQGDIGARTAQCFENLFSVLDAAGLDAGDVIKVNVYLTDMADFEAMNLTYASQFSQPFPARTTIGVASLPLGSDIEIELIARAKQI